MPGRVRQLLFEGSGLVDYDLASSHWSIFQSLGRALGFPTPKGDMYVNHKADWHGRWAYDTAHGNRNEFNALAASWLTGATLSTSPRTASGRRLGASAIQVLREDPPTMSLYKEIQQGMKRIVREALKSEMDGAEKVYVNAVGKRLTLANSAADFGRLCSHVLTGYEQFAIREMCEDVVGLQACIYDGFIAPAQQVEPLEDRVRQRSSEALGMTLEVRLKVVDVSERVPDLELDPDDL